MARIALCDVRGPLQQLLDVLAGEDGDSWVEALKRFLRKENPWTASSLPTSMTVGGRTYDILPILRGDDKVVGSRVMVKRAKEMEAHLGQEDGEHLLAHQDEIPVALRGKVVFVFTDWRRPGRPGVGCVCWGDGRWGQRREWLVGDWGRSNRVLRRKSAA